ncbi:MAG: protein kinase domain-containing protein [Rubrivivax sp.]
MPPPTVAVSPDRARWAEVSPLLDELMDLPAAERASRLAALQAQDPALAEALQPWLAELAQLSDHPDFLQQGARSTPGGPGAVPAQADGGLAGQTVGAYRLSHEIGRGGMGSVWLAHRTDGRFEGEVAIKFLSLGWFSPAAAQRFAREGHIMARLAHPHIARLLDAGHLGPRGHHQPYLVLEHVAGEPLDTYCARVQPALPDLLRLFLQVLDAVAHAHNRLILHRDFKPSNILVTAQGQAKLLDFGIAKLLDSAQADGAELTQQVGQAFTLPYAAPEQLQGEDVTTATDVYALGVLLYRLLSGRLPLDVRGDEAALAQWRANVARTPPPVSEALRQAGGDPRRVQALRGDLDNILAKALKKLPGERYANAEALAQDLRRHLALEPISARPDTWAYRSTRFLRRHRLAVGAGSVAALVLTGSAAVALLQAREAREQQAQAEGLIEFMLGDLPQKLKPVGRLDTLDAVAQRALAYYADQAPGSLDDASLARRARALHLMGEIAEQSGRLDEAARGFEEAAASTAELLARQPLQGEAVFNHAQSSYWVGLVARRRGLREQAEQAFGQYQALAQRLTELDPNNLDWQTEAAYASQNLGVMHLEAGRPAQALPAFERTLQAWQQVVPGRPAAAIELANTLGWISRAQEGLADLPAALASQQAKFQALAQLPDGDRNRDAQHLRAVAHYDIGRLQQAQGQADAARQQLQTARQLLQALVQLEPQNLDWAGTLTATWVTLAQLQRGQPEATATLAQAQRLAAPLLAATQRKQRWWLNLQGLLLTERLVQGDTSAVVATQTWLADVARHEAQGRVLDAEQARIAAAAGLALGDRLQAGDPATHAAAQAVWSAAAQRLATAVARRDLPALALHGRLRWRLGQVQEARAIAETLATSSFRAPDGQALQRELQTPAASAR